MEPFILDASVTLAWYFEDEGETVAENALDALNAEVTAYVPSLWSLEVSNAIVVGERQKRQVPVHADQFLDLLGKLPIRTLPVRRKRVYGEVLRLARRYQLSTYDATYLDLADRESLPLATLDRPLRQAAQHYGIALFG